MVTKNSHEALLMLALGVDRYAVSLTAGAASLRTPVVAENFESVPDQTGLVLKLPSEKLSAN